MNKVTAQDLYFGTTAERLANTGWVPGQLFYETTGNLYLYTSSYTWIKIGGNVTLSGNIVTKTADYTLTTNDFVVLVDADGGNVTISLPTAASAEGFVFTVKKIDASINRVTIDPDGIEQIDGDSSVWTDIENTSIVFVSDGSEWFIV